MTAEDQLTRFTNKVREMNGEDSGLGKTLKFDLGDTGAIFINGAVVPNVIDNNTGDADCTVSISADNFGKLLDGKGNPMTMFMTGKIKVKGDMSVGMKLQGLFSKKV